MKHQSPPYRTPASGSSLGKFASTLASLLTIGVILFTGSRDWQSGRPVLTTLTDLSDLRGAIDFIGRIGRKPEAASVTPEAAKPIRQALIESGKLIPRQLHIPAGEAAVPGLVHVSSDAR